MKHHLSALLTSLVVASSAPAATVFSNLASPVDGASLVKGTGGFIPVAIEYGVEFTLPAADHELTGITLGIGSSFGTLPLTVELFASPGGPNTATYLMDLTGPAQPANQFAVYAPTTPVTLSGGGTYFVRLSVNGSGGNYSVQTTTTLGSGTFSLGNAYQRNAGSPWGGGTALSQPILAINASAVPEPAGLLPGAVCFALALQRRQRRGTGRRVLC